MTITLTPIGTVHCSRREAEDDNWDAETTEIRLDPAQFSPDALMGLESFSHVDVVFHFHKVPLEKIETGARHPRGRADWPKIGIFAQRGKNRPNRLGVTTCRVLGVDGLIVKVAGLDAIDGTPVLDLKPHMLGFDARGQVREPDWAAEIMREYW